MTPVACGWPAPSLAIAPPFLYATSSARRTSVRTVPLPSRAKYGKLRCHGRANLSPARHRTGLAQISHLGLAF
jgi:hypothetical protein